MNKGKIAKPRGIIVFMLLFCLIITFGLIILIYSKPDIRLLLLMFIAFILYAVYYIIKTFTYFRVDSDYITYRFATKYSYDEVEKVIFYDFKAYRFLFFPMRQECLTVIFADGKKAMLEDDFYKNLWQIRWVLENKVLKKNDSFNFDFNIDFDCKEITNKTPPISPFVKLTPYLLYFCLISLLINSMLTYFNIYTNGLLLLLSFLGLMALVIFHGRSYYMESCDKGIFVKNLVFKHINKKIALNQIDSIKLKTIGGGRNKTTQLVIHMNYHRDYKFTIDFINDDRTQNIIQQVKKLNVDFQDLRY